MHGEYERSEPLEGARAKPLAVVSQRLVYETRPLWVARLPERLSKSQA